MEIKALQGLVLQELSLDNMKLMLDLEKAVNENTENANFKAMKIKTLLQELVINEASAMKFQALFNNKKEENPQENG